MKRFDHNSLSKSTVEHSEAFHDRHTDDLEFDLVNKSPASGGSFFGMLVTVLLYVTLITSWESFENVKWWSRKGFKRVWKGG